jgi:uncharacterized membrane protein YedE/YeeE
MQSDRTKAWQEPLVILFSGLLFGFGLALSQMINPDRVLGFLDILGQWDPTLLFVLGGAVGVTIVSFRFILPRSRPLLAAQFYLPAATKIDVPLIAGAALFGIGWGISGYCPGPGWVSLMLRTSNPFLFVLAFLAGSFTYNAVAKRKTNSSSSLSE